MLSLVFDLCCLGLFFVLGRFRGSSSGCCRRRNKWYQSFPGFAWDLSGDLEGSGSDSVEIVCRSQIRGIRVRGIMCRSQEDARRARGICGGVDPVRNSI